MIELPCIVGLLYDNASVGPFLVGLKDLIKMDYSKPLTPNLCGYSVTGLSGMDGFKEHSLVGMRLTEERLPILLFFGWLAVGHPVRMGIKTSITAMSWGPMGPRSWPVS